MKGKTPRRYSSEFKIKLVKEYLGTNKSYTELGVEYDVDASLIMSWVKRYERYKENAFQPPKRKPSFIADESKIPAFLKEELGLDKIKEHSDDPEEINAELERLKLELAERDLRIRILKEKLKKTNMEENQGKK